MNLDPRLTEAEHIQADDFDPRATVLAYTGAILFGIAFWAAVIVWGVWAA